MDGGTDQDERAPERLPVALRAWAVPDVVLLPSSAGLPARHPRWLLVFDTETRLDPAQAMTFGFARLYRPKLRPEADSPGGFECYGEFLIVGDVLTASELDILEAWVDAHPTADHHGRFWDRHTSTFRSQEVRNWHTPDGVPLEVMSRRDFVRFRLFPMIRTGRALVVGFNLPFDLSRLAIDWGATRRARRRRKKDGSLPKRTKAWDSFTGGFSLRYDEPNDRWLPRIAIKTIDSKRHLIQLRGAEDGDAIPPDPVEERFQVPSFHGHFLDLRTLAFALTNEGMSLASAATTFETTHRKFEYEPTGTVSADELEYARNDVVVTFELAEKLLAEYGRHPISPDSAAPAIELLQATKAYSPASIGKAYLRAMGITPPMERGWRMPADLLGHAMTAFYGGRAECRIRRVPVPVTYVDFTSMYPTVNGLMGLWEVLTAADLDLVDATVEVQSFVANVDLDGVFQAATWRELRVLVEVDPAGEILPTRAAYEGDGHGWQIGINPLTSEQPLWFALADVVAAKLLSGRAPKIRRAIRLVPSGALSTLRPVELRGEVTVDPAMSDFFAAVIERRNALADRDGADKPLSDFLKVLANATSYGIFAEMVRHELPASERVAATIHGLGPTIKKDLATPEEPGEFAFPPLAVLITAAARLMLAALERSVTDAGGTYAMVDTDSMAVVSSEDGGLVACQGGPERLLDGREAVRALPWATVDQIRSRFSTSLNPYAPGAVRQILKLEDVNHPLAPTSTNENAVDSTRREQLYAFAISAKRYALYNLDADGQPVIRKASEHGLGHLLNPDDPENTSRDWIRLAWRNLVAESLGQAEQSVRFARRAAVGRITASSPAVLAPFATHNTGRSFNEQVRPFNFLLAAHVARAAIPGGADPAHFQLIGRFIRDPVQWTKVQWVDRYAMPPRSYQVTTGPAAGDLVRVRSLATVLAEYRIHPEAKSLGPGNEPDRRRAVGLLRRRPAIATSFTFIGKEANDWETVESGLFHDLDEVVNDYGSNADEWRDVILPALQEIPTGKLAALTGLERKTIQRTKSGKTRPHPRNIETFRQALTEWQSPQT